MATIFQLKKMACLAKATSAPIEAGD